MKLKQGRTSTTPLPGRRHGPVAFSVLALLICSQPATATPSERPRVAVIPLGRTKSFTPTARVADALVRELTRKKRARSRLGYFMPAETTLPADTEQAESAYTRAEEDFQALEFATVREHLATAIKLYKAQIEAGGAADGYLKALHLLAATELFDNQEEAASRAMSDAIAFSRKPPSKRLFNPTVQQLHAEVLADPERGELVVRSSLGALIWLNGRLRGYAGNKRRLRPGLYWVRIFRPDYAPWLAWVRIKRGESQAATTKLRPLKTGDAPLMADLRQATKAPTPGPEVAEAARELRAQQLILVSPRGPCSAQHCIVVMNWAADGSWLRRGEALYTGQAGKTAAQLLSGADGRRSLAHAVDPQQDPPRRSCRMDSDCIHGHSCEEGLCQRPDPVTGKWWFWTIVGVVAAGAAAGVAVPLLLPSSPVIEVQ